MHRLQRSGGITYRVQRPGGCNRAYRSREGVVHILQRSVMCNAQIAEVRRV